VHYIATEYGVANLRARSMNERASDLIKVAAPQFQEQLAREARDTWGLHIKG
jgi:acyl-CoA hydrolase